MRSRKGAAFRPAIRMRWAPAVIAMLMLACVPLPAADLASSLGAYSPKPIPTHAGLRLVVKAACANVQILTDASGSVSYTVRSDSKTADAYPNYLRHFLFTVHETPRGVVLIAPAAEESDCRVHVTYEIHVPRRYDLDVALRAGNIVAQDIDGAIAFSTGGGEIQTGNIGATDSTAKDAANASFLAQLHTAAGDISVGNVGGGLHAATRGGQLSAGDVHGPAVLRTGGGDIRIGHVFGGARFTSGGGDIVIRKVDGGLWADTAGGRVAIGNASRLSAAEPRFPAGFTDAFATPEIRRSSADPQVVPGGNDLADVGQIARLFDLLFRGGIRVDPLDQQSRLIHSIAPEYPDVARRAGIEGDVVLRIFVARDGSIRDVDAVSGPPVLARAAMRAVEEWRYAPALVNREPVQVITSVTLAFRLHS